MENASEALYIGFAMFIFMIALSVSIFAFTNVTSASQSIIDARDKTSMYTYVQPNGTERTVSAEDIIPTLYRAYYENYMVRFVGLEDELYSIKNEGADREQHPYVETYTIDLEGQKIGNHKDANDLITHLLQGNLGELFNNDTENRFSYFDHENLPNSGLYDKIKGKSFKEQIGLYYMEDRINGVNSFNSDVEDVNKIKKRVITYTVTNNN